MARRAKRGSAGSGGGGRGTISVGALSRPGRYMVLSARPLHVAVFLLPLIVLYEVGSAVYLVTPAGPVRLEADRLIDEFFRSFGVVGVLAPALALLVVLVVRHVLERHSWRVRPGVLAGMLVESLGWTLPLLVFSALVSRALAAQAAAPGVDVGALPWQARATVALGAGLYEEMLFRLIGITLVHFLVADLLRLGNRAASVTAVCATAAAFVLFHQLRLETGGIDWARAAVLAGGGVYFGVLFLTRGFGIAAATHAFYDLLVLVLMRG